MGRRLPIAIAIGAIIPIVLWAIASLSSAFESLLTPGIMTAMLIFGAHGWTSEIILLGSVICYAVNAICYGLVAFAVLSVLKISN
jgi:hypothetical protein